MATVPEGMVDGVDEMEMGEVAGAMYSVTVTLLLPEPSSNSNVSVVAPSPLLLYWISAAEWLVTNAVPCFAATVTSLMAKPLMEHDEASMVIVAPAAMGDPALALDGVNVVQAARDIPGTANMTHNSKNAIQRPHTLRPSP